MIEGYDVAQVCLSGHAVNGSTRNSPEFNQTYCNKCGHKTITQCPNCKTPIKGELWTPGVLPIGRYEPPAFCQHCGSSFPWTHGRIEAAIEMSLNEGKLHGDEVEQLKQSMNEVVRDTPKTQVAATRLKRLLQKLSTNTTRAVHDLMVDTISETAKKIMYP